MLEIHGRHRGGYCDGQSRRHFIQAGAFGFGGLMLSDLLRAEAAAGIGSSNKALINVQLGGGPSHQDMWDLKPNAPVEFRGEFTPIKTNVPGVEICELFPSLAKMADKFAIIRGMVGSVNEHSSSTAMTAYRQRDLDNAGGHPSVGSVISRLCNGAGHHGSPPYVSLMGSLTPGYLGPIYSPFVPSGAGRDDLQMQSSVSAERLQGRTTLLGKLDSLRRDIDRTGKMDALDAYTQRAVGVVTSGKMAQALDLKNEDPEVVKRYEGNGDGRNRGNRNFLLARRMIEAGVRCVALNWGGWDTHSDNFNSLRKQLPALDLGLSALIQDLYDRGMFNDVTIVVWGEFGRTPRVNGSAGRDHWPRVAAAWLAGGGIKAGQVVGESDRIASDAAVPVHLHQVHSTLYHNMGINVKTQQFNDLAGRPQYLLDIREPIRELV